MIVVATLGWITAAVVAVLWRRDHVRRERDLALTVDELRSARERFCVVTEEKLVWMERAMSFDRQNEQLCAIVDELREQLGRNHAP